eukprot:1145541-Pelagomonas_calceolata.AAC.2
MKRACSLHMIASDAARMELALLWNLCSQEWSCVGCELSGMRLRLERSLCMDGHLNCRMTPMQGKCRKRRKPCATLLGQVPPFRMVAHSPPPLPQLHRAQNPILHVWCAEQSPEPWQQPGEDNGRPWVAPWVTSVHTAEEEGSTSEQSDSEGGDWHIASWVSLLVVAFVAASVGLAAGMALAKGGFSTGWQWPRNVFQWVQGRRGGWTQVGKGERGCELETLDRGEDGMGGRSGTVVAQTTSAV